MIKHNLCILNAGTMGSIASAFEINYEEFLEALKINRKIETRSRLSLGFLLRQTG